MDSVCWVEYSMVGGLGEGGVWALRFNSPCEPEAFGLGLLVTKQSSLYEECGQGIRGKEGERLSCRRCTLHVVGFGLHPTCAQPEVESFRLTLLPGGTEDLGPARCELLCWLSQCLCPLSLLGKAPEPSLPSKE